MRSLLLPLLGLIPLLAGCALFDPDNRMAHRHRAQVQSPEMLRAPDPPPEGQYFIFTGFRNQRGGPTSFGLYLLVSQDGYDWHRLNETAIFTPEVGRAHGMRDPAIARGPDGTFHLVWTWQRGSPHGIGYASSTDLINWSEPRDLRVMPPELPNDYCWAPELLYDHQQDHWVIVWSSEVEGHFEETAADTAHNHRFYYTTTRDFETLERTRLFFDPGYAVIDPAFARLDQTDAQSARYIMFFKDQRIRPARRQLRMATAYSIYGPWSNISRAITRHNVEGPTVLRIGDDWLVYFDEYETQRYGAIRSQDLRRWDDVSALMNFPGDHRHGSVLQISPEIAHTLFDLFGFEPGPAE